MAAPVAAAVWVFITYILGSLVSKIIVLLGISLVTFTGITAGIDAAQSYVETQMGGLPSHMLQLIAMLQLDTAIAMILAAYSARVTVKLVSGALSTFNIGPAQGSLWTQ